MEFVRDGEADEGTAELLWDGVWDMWRLMGFASLVSAGILWMAHGIRRFTSYIGVWYTAV